MLVDYDISTSRLSITLVLVIVGGRWCGFGHIRGIIKHAKPKCWLKSYSPTRGTSPSPHPPCGGLAVEENAPKAEELPLARRPVPGVPVPLQPR